MAKKRRKRRKKRSVADRIIPISEASPHVKILVYGRNGKGKTRFAASAPKVLILDVNEKGTRSARKIKSARVLPVEDWADFAEAYWYLKEGDHPYESVAIDTLTAMQTLCMNQVLYEAAERDPTIDPKQATMRNWGKTATLMKDELLRFRNLPMNVIFTAQERTTGDPEEGEPLLHTVDLPAGSRGAAMGAVEVIGRLYHKEVKSRNKKTKKRRSVWETRMLVGPHDDFDTKDRTGALGRIVREPTVPKIIHAAFQEEDD